MRVSLFIALTLAISLPLARGQEVGFGEPIPLRSGAVAGPATQAAVAERSDAAGERFYNVSQPAIYVWPAPADKASGTAIIACPGGSYDHVTMGPEGLAIARWLNPMGITVIGLKYRTKPPSADVAADALADGQLAMRVVRSRAAEWKIDPKKLGMLGYSAGANLALNVASHFDSGSATASDPAEKQSCRPDFVVLLSTWPNAKPIDAFPLRADSPPMFIAIAKDDRTAPPPFTAQIKARLDELKVPTTLYEAERGGHGAFHLDGAGVDTGWKEPFLEWMKKSGWM